MRLMEEMILANGRVLPGNVLRVGSFLNQMVDVKLLRESGAEIARLFADCGVTKILTIEASGIALAAAAALTLDVPFVFAKKEKTSNVEGALYTARVHSYTHGNDCTICLNCDYLSADDTILIVDDFLASGEALRGLIALTAQAGAKLAGAAVAVEKCFQTGGDALRADGLRVESLACIASMENGVIRFRGDAGAHENDRN